MLTRISEKDFAGERSMINEPYKLVLADNSPNGRGIELYDIHNDPGEATNLAGKYPEMIKEMQVELYKWQESVLNSLTGADYN